MLILCCRSHCSNKKLSFSVTELISRVNFIFSEPPSGPNSSMFACLKAEDPWGRWGWGGAGIPLEQNALSDWRGVNSEMTSARLCSLNRPSWGSRGRSIWWQNLHRAEENTDRLRLWFTLCCCDQQPEEALISSVLLLPHETQRQGLTAETVRLSLMACNAPCMFPSTQKSSSSLNYIHGEFTCSGQTLAPETVEFAAERWLIARNI